MAPDSKSCPVLGSSDATGVPYGLALNYAFSLRISVDGHAQTLAFEAMSAAAGGWPAVQCANLILNHRREGHIVGRGL